MKNLLAFVALSSAALLASAGPVVVSGSTQALPSSFTANHSVNLASGGVFDFSLRSASYGVDDVLLNSVRFSQGNQSILFDAIADASQLLPMGLTTDLVALDPDDPDFFVTRFTRDYSMTSMALGAGAWTVSIGGVDSDNKVLSEYTLTMNRSQVPEPAALALLLAALVPALGLSKKRRAV